MACGFGFDTDGTIDMVTYAHILSLSDTGIRLRTRGKFPDVEKFLDRTINGILCQILIHEQTCEESSESINNSEFPTCEKFLSES